MFPSGNKKTFVSVLVLLLLQDIYFDSNFFFSRRFRYMLFQLITRYRFLFYFSLFFVSMFLSHYAVVNVRKSHATSGRFTALKRGQLD